MKTLLPWLSKITLVAMIVYTALMWTGLGRDYLFDWDEGIYAQIGQEMRLSGDFLTPTWNGELWLEKPPLIAWVTSLGLTLAGDSELGALFFMPLFALATLYAVFRIGQTLGGTLMGSASTAILGYFNLFLSRARTLNTDGILLAGITWSFWLLLSHASPIWVGIIMGLSIMVKGPAGIMAILITLPLLIKKPRNYILSTISYLLATIIPWHLYALILHGKAFVTPYLLEQVIRRATVPIEFHLESRWFYFNFLLKDLGIGVVLVVLFGFALMLYRLLKHKSLGNLSLILWWVGLPLVLFTLAKTRLAWYILPVYPAIALSIGYAITSLVDTVKSSKVVTILVIGMLAQMLLGGFKYIDYGRPSSPLSPHIQVAQDLSRYPGKNIAMLVSPNERIAEAILPADQTISSSFRYGGAPSVVFYSQKHVIFYYNYDDFVRDLSLGNDLDFVIITAPDLDKVPTNFKQVTSADNYLGFVREEAYALR